MDIFNPFQPSVAFHIEPSSANQMNAFFVKSNSVLVAYTALKM